jgi:hypothetical protein
MCRSRSEALLPTETNASVQFSSDNSEEMMEMTARAVSNGEFSTETISEGDS